MYNEMLAILYYTRRQLSSGFTAPPLTFFQTKTRYVLLLQFVR